MGGVIVGALPYRAVSRWLRDNGYRPGSERWERAEQLLYALDRDYCKVENARLNSTGSNPPDKGKGEGGAGGDA